MANPSPGKGASAPALRHGAYSGELIAAEAHELIPAIYEVNKHLDERDRPAVVRYASVLARLSRAYRWLGSDDRNPVFENEDAGTVHPVFEVVVRWERLAAECEAALAISPRERAKLGLDLARGDSMVRQMQRGNK